MPCYSPLKGYRSVQKNSNGKYPLVFKPQEGFIDLHIDVPCGQCIGCRLERSRQWAVRCVHEASMYDKNCFITLTYNDENLPLNSSLDKRAFQLFMKRLRKKFGANIRFFHCGEYGENFGRPHYHACIFNFDFSDKKLFRVVNGHKLYTSESLSDLWPYGYCTIGSVTFESAAYVARYILKKITGDAAEAHYNSFDSETGEVFKRIPEYTTMSRRPGIGKTWFDKFGAGCYPFDEVIMRGKKMRPPRFYDTLFEHRSPSEMAIVRTARKKFGKKLLDNNTSARLFVREQVQLERLKRLPRALT